MSKKFPECPRFEHTRCKDYLNQSVCAMAKRDKICTKTPPKKKPSDIYVPEEFKINYVRIR